MSPKDIIAQIIFKPNCGLENTRAALVMRRIAPLCDSMSSHPPSVKSDPKTIAYLCDHGLFIRFTSPMPEQVLLAIRASFFVDRCILVEDPKNIPPLDTCEADSYEGSEITSLDNPSVFTGRDAQGKHDDTLVDLLTKFEEMRRALRTRAEATPDDRELSNIAFSCAQAVEGLRTAIARSRIEPFDRIVPSLYKLVEDYSRRFGIRVNLVVTEDNLELDRAVLASMEETIRRTLRCCIRDGIENPSVRSAAGKPADATIHLRLENDGPDIACHIEHDGYPLNTRHIGEMALERGFLTRPLETYSDDEIGSFLFLPRFALANASTHGQVFIDLGEIGATLQHTGGYGKALNTERGTLEIVLRFPVPFTVLEVALIRAGETRFAVPAQQIIRFVPFDAMRIEQGNYDVWYVDENALHYKLLNEERSSSVIKATKPVYIILLDILGKRCALAVDSVHGYERVWVNQLPALLDRKSVRRAGCIGYTVLESGSPCLVLSMQQYMHVLLENGDTHE